jgi:hypothetical protein
VRVQTKFAVPLADEQLRIETGLCARPRQRSAVFAFQRPAGGLIRNYLFFTGLLPPHRGPALDAGPGCFLAKQAVISGAKRKAQARVKCGQTGRVSWELYAVAS